MSLKNNKKNILFESEYQTEMRELFEGIDGVSLKEESYRPPKSVMQDIYDFANKQFFNGSLPNNVTIGYYNPDAVRFRKNWYLENNQMIGDVSRQLNLENIEISSISLGITYSHCDVVCKRQKRNEIDLQKTIQEDVGYTGLFINETKSITKKQFLEVFIHEMIHVYQFFFKPKLLAVDGGHGEFFQKKAREISVKAENVIQITTVCDQVLITTSDEKMSKTVIDSDHMLMVVFPKSNREDSYCTIIPKAFKYLIAVLFFEYKMEDNVDIIYTYDLPKKEEEWFKSHGVSFIFGNKTDTVAALNSIASLANYLMRLNKDIKGYLPRFKCDYFSQIVQAIKDDAFDWKTFKDKNKDDELRPRTRQFYNKYIYELENVVELVQSAKLNNLASQIVVEGKKVKNIKSIKKFEPSIPLKLNNKYINQKEMTPLDDDEKMFLTGIVEIDDDNNYNEENTEQKYGCCIALI